MDAYTATSNAGNTYRFVIRKGTRGYYVGTTDNRVTKWYGPYPTDMVAIVARDEIVALMRQTGRFPVEAK